MRDRYNAVQIDLIENGRRHWLFRLDFRVYDEAVAFCYSLPRMRGGVSKNGGNSSLAGEHDHGEPYTGTKLETTDTAKGMHLQPGSVRKDNQRAGCPPRGGIRKACGEVPGRNRGGPPP